MNVTEGLRREQQGGAGSGSVAPTGGTLMREAAPEVSLSCCSDCQLGTQACVIQGHSDDLSLFPFLQFRGRKRGHSSAQLLPGAPWALLCGAWVKPRALHTERAASHLTLGLTRQARLTAAAHREGVTTLREQEHLSFRRRTLCPWA